MSEIKEVIKKVKAQFPDLRVWQMSQITENDDGLWKFWLDGITESEFLVDVSSGIGFAGFPKRNIVKEDDDIAQWICNYFNKIQKLR